MNFVIYCLLSSICCLVQFGASSPLGNELTRNKQHKVSGCLHNNTMFADTSIVPSSEPCLVCKCSKRNLVCVRRVCKDQPYPPPRGCILVQKKSQCCPYLSCSKYHVNFYKNSQKSHEHVYNNYQITHEKTLEKHSRTDDDDEHHDDVNGGCIESGSLYASGSAMYRSSASLCSYCYCINGLQKCIKPKCILKNTKCKPIFMEASCCPIKYECNSTAGQTTEITDENGVDVDGKIKNHSNVCSENGHYYKEGERFPLNDQRPCEVCYCIKGIRKCVMKKCAPFIHGCVPKVPAHGACCPTSYDCRRRSLKVKRHSRQENEDEEEEEVEEDGDTIDFFSLLFGSDEPKEKEVIVQEVSTTSVPSSSMSTTTLPPFKALPSTTESSFFDFIRAGLEIIDANADKIDAQINKVVPSSSELTSTTESTQKTSETSATSSEIKTSVASSISEMKKLPSSTQMPKTSSLSTSSSTLSIKPSTESVTVMTTTQRTTLNASVKMSSTTTLEAKKPATTTRKTSSRTPSTTKKSTIQAISTNSPKTTTRKTTTKKMTTARTTTTTQVPPKMTTRKVFVETTKRPSIGAPQKFIVPSLVETLQQQRLPSIIHFNTHVPDKKYMPDDADNEADTLPNLEIIPFVAHDAIRTDKYEPYLSQPYDHGLEKDYFANGDNSGVVTVVKEKPFRYNNKFIHHNYDDSVDYVYTNPHDRIDNGPYYYENQFESFSPPNVQDFLGGFSPKETYDGVSTSAKLPPPNEPQSLHKEEAVKPFETHEHKSSTDKNAASSAINQTAVESQMDEEVKHQQQLNITTEASISTTTLPNFKKISSNFTSFINDLLQVNALDETKAPIELTTSSTIKSTTTRKSTSTIAPVKSIINDDDFIKKHLKATSTTTSVSNSSQKQQQQQQMEIFSKPTNPSMNGLLKLAGCNIYGSMYEVGQVIAELSSPCLECKCLPDIGVGCMQMKC